MVWFKRISLFLVTNLLVMATLSIVWSLVSSALGIQGTGSMGGLMLMCVVWGMGGAFISLLMSKFFAKMSMGVQILDPQTTTGEYRALVLKVHELASRAGLSKMPEVGIYESPEINAFATGPSRNNSMVAVSTGLLSAMNSDEVEGVLGHEVAHIANGDMVTMTLIQGIINAFVMFFSRIVARIVSSQVDEKYSSIVYFVSTFVFDIAFTILGSVVVNYFSRRREFRADAGGAQFAGREKMIAGLVKLQRQFDQIAPDTSGAATLKISSKSSGLMALFSTHPALEERIRRLQMGTNF